MPSFLSRNPKCSLFALCTIAFALFSCKASPTVPETSSTVAQSSNSWAPVVPNTSLATNPVEYYGQLQVVGSEILGARSMRPAQVKGMSFYWTKWGGGLFYNKPAVTTLAQSWHAEIVRAAMAPDGYINDPSSQMDYVNTLVQAAIENGIYVIIDWHDHKATTPEHSVAAYEFFSAMALKWGAFDNVIFEIYNEPLNEKWPDIKNYANTIIAGIRQFSDNLIIVGTPNFSQDVDVAAADPIYDVNTAYALHFYAGSHGSALRIKAISAMLNGAALFVSEFGTVNADGNGEVDAGSTDQWMAFLDQYKISWANWSMHKIPEGASALLGDADTEGLTWATRDGLTVSGQYIFDKLQFHAQSSEWRIATGRALF